MLLSFVAAMAAAAATPQETLPATLDLPVVPTDQTTPAAPVQTSAFASATPLEAKALGQETAREDLAQIAQANQAASVSHNSVNGNSQTGSVTFSDSAFQGVRGLTVVNANSGNNVAVNSAMNVNIYFNPAP
ncbi:hypothetical protein [Sphingomonas aerophila]|uniref:Uncharacterized protein n=1 Tax=Sphingomonas aerophila TaxID=1344948 RepID=A0A7W9BBU6_9SPHN|nr:hypothetical protein [Sphingomonas aerophila]MBB5714355.1 hypothetical protein [Sphingomonas aerophila]